MNIPLKYEDLVLKVAEMERRETALRESLTDNRDEYNKLGDRYDDLQQRLTVAERDARRYRYLREGAVMHYMSAEGSESKDAYLTITGYGHDDSVASIDNAIDAQMLAALNPAAGSRCY